jgi:hypothetical protein
MLQKQLDDSAMKFATLQRHAQDLDRDLCVSKMTVTKLGVKFEKLEAELPATYLKLLGKLGKLEHRIADMEEARHVEQHERSSKGAGNM